MDNKSSFDRSLLIPIVIGVFSLCGICLVLLAGRLSAARGGVQGGVTATPQKYQYLGTEPAVVFPTDLPTVTMAPPTIAPTADVLQTPIVLSSPPSPRATSTRLAPRATLTRPAATKSIATTVSPTPTILSLNVKYDDADFKFLYTGNWVAQTAVSGPYLNTLHISNTIGDAVQLSFVGQKIRYAYQAGPSLGAIAIKLDGVDFALDQSAVNTTLSEWESPILVRSSHSITITHISGGSINIDSISVIDLGTPTPTPKP